MPETAHLVYFSPTGTTRTTCVQIAKGLSAKQIIHYDVTLPGDLLATTLTEGVVIFGVPVYAGRVPELCLQRFVAISAQALPCILVALYGNREFEDALVELRDVVTKQGFQVVAAAAFIGEHSYSIPARPIAAGRPNAEDLAIAKQFGRDVAAKLCNNDLSLPRIDGNMPYRERFPLGGVAPETDHDRCTLCGKCAAVCPTGVIDVADTVLTHAADCVMCCACVKICTVDARPFNHPRIEERRAMLLQNCSSPKAPTLFLV
ncbi:MAG: 4Fe-4S binding protein [Desulfuromonadales bacterium]